MDIYDLAKANDANIAERFEHAAAADDAGLIAALSKEVDTTSRFSINMRPHVMAALLTGAAYQNVYDVAERYSVITGRLRDDELKYLLGKYHAKRIEFDTKLGIPESTYYAAVNIGGVGCRLYGEFCTIITGPILTNSNSVLLKSDSLLNYIKNDLTIDQEKLSSDLASSFNVGKLIALKHMNDDALTHQVSWADMVCNDNDFVEAYVDQSLQNNGVEEIRILEADHDALMELAFFSSSGPPKGAADRALVADFVSIKESAINLNISIKVIKGNSL